ncbi:MAG: DUF4290 domain-containing protein [Paludibacteraceae bacterium]
MEQTLNRNTSSIKMRNYGRILQDMVAFACTIENKEEREALVLYIAQCMRQKNLVWNKDQEAGMNRVREDIETLSEGRLSCDFEAFRSLPAVSTSQQNQQGQNKKKKR